MGDGPEYTSPGHGRLAHLDRKGLAPLLSIGSAFTMDERFITTEVIRGIEACDISFTEYNTVRALRLEDGQFERKRFGGAWALPSLGFIPRAAPWPAEDAP